MVQHGIADVKKLQSLQIPDFFPAYKKTAWQPHSDVAADKFWHACVQEEDGLVLHDVVNAIETVLGIKLHSEALTPRSAYSPDMIRKQAESQMKGGKLGKYDTQILKQAYLKVRRMFLIPNLRPLKLEDTPYKPETSAGLPSMVSKAEDYPRALAEARALQENQRLAPPPTVLFHRGKNMEEARYVNGYPFSMSLIEGRFFYPFQAATMLHHTPYAGGRYDFEMAPLLNEIRVKSKYVVELDYSKFDSSIPALLSSMAFSIIRDSFVMDEQDKMDWDRITRYFHTSPFLCPDGFIYSGRRHGVPSGSCFTQVIDSLVNAICLEYAARKLSFKTSRYFIMGDDSVMGVYSPVSIKAIAATLLELGIHVNERKSEVKDPEDFIHFTGHDWKGAKASRPLLETLVRLVTPERKRKDYYSKNKEEKRKAFIQRILNYQDDNPDAAYPLEGLLWFYHATDANRKYWVKTSRQKGRWIGSFYTDYNYMFFGADAMIETNELSRWKAEKREIRLGNFRGQTLFL